MNMKAIIIGVAISVAVAVMAPKLASMWWLFAIVAAGAWLYMLGMILAKHGALPDSLASLLLGKGIKASLTSGVKAEQREKRRQEMLATVTRAAVETGLNNRFVGQQALNEAVARAVERHVAKKNPVEPLSLLLAGPPSSGRSSFAEMLAQAMFGEKGTVKRIDCAGDSSVDWADIAKAYEANPLTVLLVDGIDRVGTALTSGSFGTEMARLLEDGTILGVKGKASRGFVVLTSSIAESEAKDLHKKHGEQGLEHLLAEMRKTALGNAQIGVDVTGRVTLPLVISPVEDMGKAAIVWRLFCESVKVEHGIVINQEGGDGLDEFLMRAMEKWQTASHGIGVREASRWVAEVAGESLIEAAREGITHAFASYDVDQGRILLERDMVAEEAARKANQAARGPSLEDHLKGRAGKLNRKLGMMKADA